LWYSPNADATNSSGFSGAPGGYRGSLGEYFSVGNFGGWWSSSENESDVAWFHYLNYYFGNAYRNFNYKQFGFSVRCLRD
jgi:uncharacterized protein (TIGR02145 family)